MSAKTPILPKDIRKGDSLRAEFTDSTEFKPSALEYEAESKCHTWSSGRPTNYFLLNRPVPPVVLPTEPGVYEGYDKLAERPLIARLLIDGRFVDSVFYEVLGDLERFAPLTRLRPETEVAAEVIRDARAEIINLGASPTSRYVEVLDGVAARWATK